MKNYPGYKASVSLFVISILIFIDASIYAQGFRLRITNPDDALDETLIFINNNATDSVDAQYDLPKVRDTSEIFIYSKIGTNNFSDQGLSPLTNDKTIPIGIDALVSGMHRLEISDIHDMDESVAIILEDITIGTSVNLRANPYYWVNLTAGSGISRFRVRLNPPLVLSAVNADCDGTESMIEIAQAGSYAWNYEVKNENHAVIDAASSWNGVKELTGLPTGNYTIEFSDAYGYSIEKHADVVSKEHVVAQFQVSDSIASVNQPVYFYDYSLGAFDYIWDFGDGHVLTGTAFPNNVFSHPGTYNVQFTALNNDCADVTVKTILVKDSATTTGINSIDGKQPLIYSCGNEVFVNFSKQLSNPKIEIYNTSGQEIYHNALNSSGEQRIDLTNVHGFCLVKVLSDGKYFDAKVYLPQ